MINPTKKDIGKRVIYHGFNKKEYGVITSFNEKFVFVRYDNQHPESNGQATNRDDLFWDNFMNYKGDIDLSKIN